MCAEESARYKLSVKRARKGKPPRLERIFQSIAAPLFFVTFTTYGRRPILARSEVHAAFGSYCAGAQEAGIAVGRYVIMPDHIHLFACFGSAATVTLGVWMRGLKRRLAESCAEAGEPKFGYPTQQLKSWWQPGFFDHLLRNEESYAQKWEYVRENPVRAGLVNDAKDWPYAGEIVIIDRL